MDNSILVVESDPFIREVLGKRLRNLGCEVDEACAGPEALAKMEGHRPDLVISNWGLPGMDGQELCRRIKGSGETRSIYFILLTAHDQDDEVVATLEAGADEYLVKPVDLKQLLARVKAGLRIVNLQRELEQSNAQLNEALRQIDSELQVVARIQRSLLPQALPCVQGLDFGAFYRPSSRSGGDYYDVLALGEGRLGLVMADVSGHGAPAMVAMSLARFLVHNAAAEEHSPGRLLSTLNRKLTGHLPTEQYITMFYGILDPARGALVYSSAGQTPPLWMQGPSGAIEALPRCEGFPLKLVRPDVTYDDSELQLRGGDTLLLYTDGVSDTLNEDLELFGLERLKRSLRKHRSAPANARVTRIVEDADAFAAGQPQNDDITLLAIDFH